MQTHVQKWGNSLAIRIPVKLSHKLHITQGTLVDIDINNNQLITSPQGYTLNTMLQAISNENMHRSMLDDSPQGHEEW